MGRSDVPRLMSVTLTKQAVIERRKTVTRRAGWQFLEPGTPLTLCEKVMGRRKGDPLVRLAEVRVVSVRREPLNSITDADVEREGFTYSALAAHATGADTYSQDSLAQRFVRFFVHEMGGQPDQIVTRVEWEYLT